MLRILCFYTLFWLLCPNSDAQTPNCSSTDYERLMADARRLTLSGDYDKAINKLQSAKTCQPQQEAEVNRVILSVFEKVNGERKRAEEQTRKAEAERRRIYANDLVYKSQTALRDGDRNSAFRLAEFAFRYVDTDNASVTKSLIDALYYYDHPDTTNRYLPRAANLEGHIEGINSVAFSPDGKKLATGSDDKTAIIWDVATHKALMVLEGHFGIVTGVAFSPDGKRLATTSYDNTAIVWDLESGKILMTLKGHLTYVWCVAFSPDGKRLATGSHDRTVKIWDLDSGNVLMTLEGHVSSIKSIAFSPDGKWLATGAADIETDDWTAKIWDLDSGKILMTLENEFSNIWCVAFSPNGKWLATGDGINTIKIWDLDSGKVLMTFEGNYATTMSIVFSPDGKKLAAGSEDSMAKIWDLGSGKTLMTLKGHMSKVNSVAFSPDGNMLATGSADKTAKLWDLERKKALTTLEGHSGGVNSVAFSSDGKKLATGSADSTAKIWNLNIPAKPGQAVKPVMTLEGHTGSVNNVTFSPAGKSLATGSKDNTVRIWDLNNGHALTALGHASNTQNITFSPDGKKVMIRSSYDTMQTWDLGSSKTLVSLDAHTVDISDCMAFAPDHKKLATGSDSDDLTKIWDLNSLNGSGEISRVLMTLEGHTGCIKSVAFSPDGKMLATGSADSTAKIWDLNNGKATVTLAGHTGRINSVAFSPDGKWLATGSADSTAKIWEISAERLLPCWEDAGWTAGLILSQLQQYGLDALLDQNPGNEQRLIATREVWQIKAFADLAASQGTGSNVLFKVAPLYARAQRLYAAALALQDERLIRQDYAAMLRHWAEVYEAEGMAAKASELDAKADTLDAAERIRQKATDQRRAAEENIQTRLRYESAVEQLEIQYHKDPTDSLRGVLVNKINSKGWYQLLTGQFSESEATIRRGLELDGNDLYLHTNLPPALLLQGKTTAAMHEYEQWKDKPFGQQDLPFYRDAFLGDLEALEAAGAIPGERLTDVKAARKMLNKR